MNKVEFVKHKGRKILIMDATDCKDPAENIATLEEAEQIIRLEPPHSVLLLTDVTGVRYNQEVVGRLRRFSAIIGPHVKASTTVGIDGMKKIVVQTLNYLTGRKIEIHPDRDSAKDWLVSQ